MVDPHAVEFFQGQLKDPANNVCLETGARGPRWASISHGIYLSIGASGIHRSLGVKVSFVQSLEMDSWKPVHLKMMELGGNRKFQDFLQEHGVPDNMPIREKYATRAAEWYRENLRALAEGASPPAPLAAGEGHLPAVTFGLASASATELVLDRVFAAVPSDGAMTDGGVSTARLSRSFSSEEQGFWDLLGRAISPKKAPTVPSSPASPPPPSIPHMPPVNAPVRDCSSRSRSLAQISDRVDAAGAVSQSSSPEPVVAGGTTRRRGHSVKRSRTSPGIGVALVLPDWLLSLSSEGERTAERLKVMSTGKMLGFGFSCDDGSGMATMPSDAAVAAPAA